MNTTDQTTAKRLVNTTGETTAEAGTASAGPGSESLPPVGTGVVLPAPWARRPPIWGVTGAGLLALLLSTWWTMPESIPGITLPGPLIAYGLPVVRLVLDLCALAAVGLSVLPRLIGYDNLDRAEPILSRARKWAVLAAFGWAISALASMVLSAAEIAPGQVPDPAGYVSSIGAGQGYVISAACALIYTCVGLLALRFGEKVPAELRVIIAVFGLLPLPVTGHASNWYWHDLSMVSMEMHVVGASVWAGGLVALAVLLAADRESLAGALPRFSKLATVSLIVVGLSGLFNGLVELALTPTTALPWSLFTTRYGLLVVAKVVFTGLIALLGATIRWRLMPGIARRQATSFTAWAALEVSIMGLAYGVAVALTRAPVA